MSEQNLMPRYSVITDKNPREIVLLRGDGCKWRKCTFCDYHFDFSKNIEENYCLNQSVLQEVTGTYKKLEVINSGSFCDLDSKTMLLIKEVCVEKGITEIHFECHWIHREEITSLRAYFSDASIEVKIKLGVETFDADYRENRLRKGISTTDVTEIAQYADEVCLLFGLEGQTLTSMRTDIETGLSYFERICINIMVENSTKIKPCKETIELFMTELYPLYRENPRVDILLNNTDFGVGK